MKSVVLFIIASLVVTHCVEPSSEDVDYDLLKMIKSLICPGNDMPIKRHNYILQITY